MSRDTIALHKIFGVIVKEVFKGLGAYFSILLLVFINVKQYYK